MTVSVRIENQYKGILFADTTVEQSIIALVGRNGCGKTRILEAIRDGYIQVSENGNIVKREEIVHFNVENLKPSIQFNFDENAYAAQIQAYSNFYIEFRQHFLADEMAFTSALSTWRQHARGVPVDIRACYRRVRKLAKALGKPPDELSTDDANSIFEFEFNSNDLNLNVGQICLNYQKQYIKNETARLWAKEHGSKNYPFKSKSQFIEVFGRPPWEFVNQILSKFLNRLEVSAPDSEFDLDYSPKLIDSSNKQQVMQEWLSGGEKVLLSLAIFLYKSRLRNEQKLSPRVILLDEPDAYLHPLMTKVLLSTLEEIANSFSCRIFFSTHSPTTIALASNKVKILNVTSDALKDIEKDTAIGELLFGVSHIAVSAQNRRQVYVESKKDAKYYETIYSHLKEFNLVSTQAVTLSFMDSGSKITRTEIEAAIKQCELNLSADDRSNLTEALVGSGNCSKVKTLVSDLRKCGNSTVFGIIDFDNTNKGTNDIVVHGQNLFYSIENAIMTPLALGMFLYNSGGDKYDKGYFGFPKRMEALQFYKQENWQKISNKISSELGFSEGGIGVLLQNGAIVTIPNEILKMNGHDYENLVTATFPELKGRPLGGRCLKQALIEDVAINLSDGNIFPSSFSEAFEKIIKSTVT